MIVYAAIAVRVDERKLERHNEKRKKRGISQQDALALVENTLSDALQHNLLFDRKTLLVGLAPCSVKLEQDGERRSDGDETN
jgi:hypothetical protein